MAYTIQLLDITDVRLNDNNPRFIKDKSFKDLVKSLKDCPALFEARPLLCNADRVILGGNMRYRAALELRYTEVPVIIMEGLTPEQEREIVIKDNGGFGSWDFEALANGWSDLPLDEWGVDLPEGWLAEPEEAPEEEEFNAEPPKEPITVLGDLYELNGHRLHCASSTDADAIEKLMDGQTAQLVFTDPPYKIETEGGCKGDIGKGLRKQGQDIEFIADFDPKDFLNVLPLVFKQKTINAYVFCNKELLPDYLVWARETGFSFNVLIWKKPNAIPIGDSHRPDIEYLILFRKSAVWNNGLSGVNYSRCLEYGRETGLHPTMKPIELIVNEMQISSNKGGVVVDFFLGSGSTLIASEQLNRLCYGQELLPAYADVIIRRWVKYMQDNNRPYTVKRNGQELSKAEIDQFFEA